MPQGVGYPERKQALVPVAQPGAGQPQTVLSQPVADNSALTAALLRGGGRVDSIGGGIGQAARTITAAGLMKQEQEQKAAQSEALAAMLSNPDASPEDLARTLAASGDTSLLSAILKNKMNPPDRRIITGADGFNYYPDTGERVIPNAQGAPAKPVSVGEGATLVNPQSGKVVYQGAAKPKKPEDLIILEDADGNKFTFREGDPRVDKAIQSGLNVVRTPQTSIQNIVGGGNQTKGRTKVDEKYAEEFVDWTTRGGASDVEKQLDQLDSAVTSLESEQNLTGPIVGQVPDAIGAAVNPRAIAVREAVEEVVQRNLRLILGAQFTEKEGERLIARAYNPKLSQQENASRVKRLLKQIKSAAQSKQQAADYFTENGTLTGWKGKLPSMTDFSAGNPIARNPQTGEEVELINGEWVPVTK